MKKWQFSVITGAMSTASCVVERLGNSVTPESNPHGTGRNYSRCAARIAFIQQQRREAIGLQYRRTEAFLTDISANDKPINQVVADASELAAILLTPYQIV